MPTYLNVPFSEKDAAKALGARWDAVQRKWFVPDGLALENFNAWLAEPVASASAPASAASNPTATGKTSSKSKKAADPNDKSQGISLSLLLNQAAQAIAQRFPSGAWTIVEITEAQSKRGHWYLGLAERTPDGQVLATARAMIWANQAQRILPEFQKATGAYLAPGIKLLVHATPTLKAQYGFSLEIDAIDAEYTLGDLEARKREIRLRLQQ